MSALSRGVERARDLVSRQLRQVPHGLPTLRPRRRRVSVATGAWLPAWALRLACAALAVGCVEVAGGGRIATVLGVVLAALVVLRPGGAGPVLVLVLTGLVLTIGGTGEGSWRAASFAVLLGTHLLVQLGALLGRTTWAARVELRALLVPAPRFLGVQLVAQVAAVVGAAATAGRLELPWLTVLAGVGLGALLLWLAPRLATRP